MPRGLWKGSIAFGLVEVPVVLQSALRGEDVKFAQLDRRDLSPVGYRHYNKGTDEEVKWEDVVRGFEYEKGRFAVLTDKDFERIDPHAAHTVEILEFVDAASIEPVYFDTPYYVVPQHANSKSFALLREALKKTGKVGVARVMIRTRERLAALLPRGSLLALVTLRFGHDVRAPKDVEAPEQDAKALRVSAAEVAMAERLIDGMTEGWRPERHADRYRDAVLEVVRRKVKAGKTTTVEEPEDEPEPRAASEVLDLMPLLKKSVATRGRGRKETAAATTARHRGAAKTTGPARARRRKTA